VKWLEAAAKCFDLMYGGDEGNLDYTDQGQSGLLTISHDARPIPYPPLDGFDEARDRGGTKSDWFSLILSRISGRFYCCRFPGRLAASNLWATILRQLGP
jgi:hypothetical protein